MSSMKLQVVESYSFPEMKLSELSYKFSPVGGKQHMARGEEEIVLWSYHNELGSAGLFWVKSGESRFIRIPEERKDPTRVPVLLSSSGAVLIISEVSQKIWKMSSFDAELEEMRVENWHQKGTDQSFAAHIMTTDEKGTFPVILSAGSQMNAGDCFTLLFIDWNQNVARWSEECSYLYEKETTREKHLQVLAERESFDAYTNPQIGSIMYKDGSIFAFTEGDVINPHRLGSSNYFWYLELTEQGIYRKKIWGEEHLKARKGKHGLRGKFSAQKDFLILSPIFDKEEWKGKQKVLSLENLNLLDLQLPRGFAKYRLLDIWNDHAFLTDDETDLAVCTFKLV